MRQGIPEASPFEGARAEAHGRHEVQLRRLLQEVLRAQPHEAAPLLSHGDQAPRLQVKCTLGEIRSKGEDIIKDEKVLSFFYAISVKNMEVEN